MISVENLKYNLTPLQNITFETTKINSTGELYGLLESILTDWVDNIFKPSLVNLNLHEYVVVGGKAITTIIKHTEKKTFDLDIHLYSSANTQLHKGRFLCI